MGKAMRWRSAGYLSQARPRRDSGMLPLGGCALIVMAVVGLRAWLPPASAHSWYPNDCCSDSDCWPMGRDDDAREPEPAIVPGGYLTHDGFFVDERDTRPSSDGRFHVCRSGGFLSGPVLAPLERPLCLFVPKLAS